MSTKHTPTPWAVNDDGYKVESDKEHGWVNDGWIVCSTEGPDNKANAELIVAAVNAYASNQSEIERLKTALKPFAEAADTTDANDDYSSASIWEHPSALDITIGDLRRARRALSEGNE